MLFTAIAIIDNLFASCVNAGIFILHLNMCLDSLTTSLYQKNKTIEEIYLKIKLNCLLLTLSAKNIDRP
jgi:hypothetical protein